MVVCGSTVTSSKDTERSLLMVAHLQKIFIITTGVAAQADGLLSTSRRTTLSRTSGDCVNNSLHFARQCAREFVRGHHLEKLTVYLELRSMKTVGIEEAYLRILWRLLC